jgi:hypothetical protein
MGRAASAAKAAALSTGGCPQGHVAAAGSATHIADAGIGSGTEGKPTQLLPGPPPACAGSGSTSSSLSRLLSGAQPQAATSTASTRGRSGRSCSNT